MKDDRDLMHDLIGYNGVRIAVIGTLAILSLFLFVEAANVAKNFSRSGAPATDTITVNGQGQATVAPDVARVTFSVENRALTVAAAQEKTTAQANAALDYVKKQGVADADVRTLSYNISPEYSYPVCPANATMCPTRQPKVTGYIVSETVQVTLRDLAKVGDMLAGLGQLQVQNLNGPSFALDDSTAGYDAARADAIAKAKAQAAVLAKDLGVSLGKIVNFSESSGGYPYPVAYGMGGGVSDKAAVAPNVPTGQNTYNATVTITYEIR